MEDYKIQYLILASSSDIITKLISLILFIKRFCYISKEVKNKYPLSLTYLNNSLKKEKENNNWSKTSIIKLIINIFLTVTSYTLAALLSIYNFFGEENIKIISDYLANNYNKDNNDNNTIKNIYNIIIIIYFSFEGIIWLLSSILHYKETKYYRNQSWNGLRFFWFSNGIYTFIKIATITFIIIKSQNNDKDKDKNEPIYTYYIIYFIYFQSLLSIILLYYSIFRPYDFTYKNIEQLLTEDEKNNELNSISRDNSLLDLTDNYDDDINNSYFKDDDELYNINIKNNEKPIIIDILIEIKSYDFKNINFIIKLKDKKYIKKKSPSELCNFLKNLIKCYKNKKYQSNIINLIQQSYNISLTLNPERNSYTGKKDSIKTLTHLCNEAIKISNNFLLDLLLFLDLSNIDLVQLLQNNNIESVIEDFENIEDESIFEINNNNTKKSINNNILNIFKNNSINDKPKILNNVGQMSRDVIKLYTFFNNIMIKDDYISIKIIKYNEEKKEIECSLKINNPFKEVLININTENIIDVLYDDELKTYYIDNIETMIEENDYSIFELLLNEYLQNIIYYDENLFNQFQLNKILNLDIEKFNEEVLINYFEDNNIECVNNIANILFDIILHPLNKDISIDNYLFSIKYTLKGIDKKNIINDDNKEVNLNLNIIKLYIIIDNILPVINAYSKKNFNELHSSLSEIRIYIENCIEILFNINADGMKKIKFKTDQEVNRAKYKKSLFGKKKINEFSSVMKNKIIEYKKDLNNLEEKKEIINEKIKQINKSITSLLNNSNLKYVLFFSEIRKILGISQIF